MDEVLRIALTTEKVKNPVRIEVAAPKDKKEKSN
jgi:hypothetical protein